MPLNRNFVLGLLLVLCGTPLSASDDKKTQPNKAIIEKYGPRPAGMVSVYERIDEVAKAKGWSFERTQRVKAIADKEIERGAPFWIK